MTPALQVRLGVKKCVIHSHTARASRADLEGRWVGALLCQRDVQSQEMEKTGLQAGEAPETGNGVGGLLLAPLWG